MSKTVSLSHQGMCRAQDFLSVGLRIYPALTAAMICSAIVIIKEGSSDSLAQDIRDMKEAMMGMKSQVQNLTADQRKVTKKKDEYIQGQVATIKTVVAVKGWKLIVSTN